jgi:hypothetical protein
MQLGKQTAALGRSFDMWRQFEWFLALCCLISGCFQISIVPFIRKDFGERYLSWLNLFFGYGVVVNLAFMGNVIGWMGGASFSKLMFLCYLAFVGLSFYHRWEISRKNKRGEEWHSLYMGSSILPLPGSDEKLHKFWEPLVVFVTGIVLWKISYLVGLWLTISALSLLLHNHILYHFERQRFLIARDAIIEARYGPMAMAGQSAKHTRGFVVAESNIQLFKNDPGLKGAFGDLSDRMKDIFDAPSDFSTGETSA